jgi:general secretion pathway protein J
MSKPRLEFSRFASADGVDSARRIAYGMNDAHEIELWLWPGLDAAPSLQPLRYPVLRDVTAFELRYLNAGHAWVMQWPSAALDPPIPRAVEVRVVLASGEDIVRVFELQ